jgi:ribosomal protein L11 methyltransferase
MLKGLPMSGYSIEIPHDPDQRDLIIADLWERGCTGIVEVDETRLRAFFDDAGSLGSLVSHYPAATYRDEAHPKDWVRIAQELFEPIHVGKRFFLVPQWRDDPAPSGRFRIVVNPGMAFGTGVHETTQLALEAMEDYLVPGMSVLDVGTGSGILAEAAGLLGAVKVFACDVDPIAAAIARGRVRDVFTGSVDAIRPHSADLSVANISPEAIQRLAPDLLRSLRPGGLLLVSGFEIHEVPLLETALPGKKEIRQKGQWALAIARLD